MPKANVFNMAGEKIGEIELSEAIFGIEPNKSVLHDSVKNLIHRWIKFIFFRVRFFAHKVRFQKREESYLIDLGITVILVNAVDHFDISDLFFIKQSEQLLTDFPCSVE